MYNTRFIKHTEDSNYYMLNVLAGMKGIPLIITATDGQDFSITW